MAPSKLTLLCLPPEIRNRIWRFTLPSHGDLEVDACVPTEPLSDTCKYVDMKRYNWKDESLLVVNHQTRDEVDPWILRQKRVLKFCTDKCLEKYLRETGDDRTARGGRAKPLDDLKVHLVVALGPPPHSRMGMAVAKMRVAGEIQKLIARLRAELISVDLMPIEIIHELRTAGEMHVWAHFVVKARRESVKSGPSIVHPDSPPRSSVYRAADRRDMEEHFARLRRQRTLRTTRSTSALALSQSGEDDIGHYHGRFDRRGGLRGAHLPRTSPRFHSHRENNSTGPLQSMGSPTHVNIGVGGRRGPRLPDGSAGLLDRET